MRGNEEGREGISKNGEIDEIEHRTDRCNETYMFHR